MPLGRRAPVDESSGALSVGVPVFNTVVRIVDEDGKELPPGEVGEFVTSGPQVVARLLGEARGDRARAARRRAAHRRRRLHGRRRLVLPRRPQEGQINASGYKVWPREVEDVLYGHPAVREAAVVGVPDDYRGETVKAFVSLKAGRGGRAEAS